MDELCIYGNIQSQPWRSVVFFCQVSGIQYVHREVDFLKSENLTDEFLAINPFQLVPALVHNGFSVYESAAMVTYLAEVYSIDNQWYPKDLKLRGRINAYLHWHHSNTRKATLEYWRSKTIRSIFYTNPDLTQKPNSPYFNKLNPVFLPNPPLTAETEASYKERFLAFMQDFEAILTQTGFVARTTEPTIADVFAYDDLSAGFMDPEDLSAFPSSSQWYLTISQIPQVHSLHSAMTENLESLINFH